MITIMMMMMMTMMFVVDSHLLTYCAAVGRRSLLSMVSYWNVHRVLHRSVVTVFLYVLLAVSLC